MAETIFADGIFFSKPDEKAPEFIKGKLSFKVDTAIAFLNQHKNDKGYVNVDLKKSKEGKLYLALNNYQAKPKVNEGEVNPADVPW